MATLVFTAVGTALGGPIGGAIGSLLGQAVDSRVFAPKPNQGPRLKELAVQTSQYGTAIPALFGRMRVAGTVIWSTDLIESKTKSGNGKGRPATINYAYRASFAVALSCRRAKRLGRIWADGTLVREDNGALSPGGVLRFHTGTGDQMPDPLIAADVGVDECPAYRGLAYAVLEDLPLADFGNRIPSLTFEVIADDVLVEDGQISLDTIARYATDGRLSAPPTPNMAATPLIGYAAEGGDLDAWLAPLIAAEGRVLSRDGENFVLTTPAIGLGAAAIIALPDDPVTTLNGVRQNDGGATFPNITAAHPPMSLRYYDAARDYQIAVQHSIGGDHALPVQGIDMPAVMDAEAAGTLIHRIAHARRTSAQGEERSVPEDWANALPIGALYTVAGHTGAGNPRTWQVTEREWLNGAVRLTARAYAASSPVMMSGSSGNHIGTVVAQGGATHMLAVELPLIPGLNTTAFLTAAGDGAGWRGAMAYTDEGGIARPLGWLGRGAVIGASVAALTAHAGLLSSPGAALEIDLLHADMDLPPANPTNPPLIWINGEIISYADAAPVTGTRWRLTGLIRALYNSAALQAHSVGSMALLLDDAIPYWPLNIAAAPIGSTLTYTAEGTNDDPPAMAGLTVRHLALRPPAPVHGQWRRDGATLRLNWTRRSRTSALWQDYLDTALGEAAELYRVDADSNAGGAFWEVAAPTLTVPIPQLPPAIGGTHTLSIRHIGDTGASEPLVLTIPADALI
jgi:Putative phage tail protein